MHHWRSYIGVAAAVAVLAISRHESRAQTALTYDTYLPSFVARVCDSFSDALAQAPKSQTLGRLSRFSTAKEFHQCKFRPISAINFQRAVEIEPYYAWVFSYDPQSSTTAATLIDGREYRVPIAHGKRIVSFYRALIEDGNGPRVAWIEIPEYPYILEYLIATKRSAR